MQETTLQPSFHYRRDILEKIFEKIRYGQSCYLISSPRMGKTRLIDFMMRNDVQKSYLENEPLPTYLVKIDINRLVRKNGWEAGGVYELIFSSLILSLNSIDDIREFQGDYRSAYMDLLFDYSNEKWFDRLQDSLKKFCAHHKVCLIFTDFDYLLRNVAKSTIETLRKLQDENKGKLCYILFLRELPEELNFLTNDQDFYSLFGKSSIPFGPYNFEDSVYILQNLEARRGRLLDSSEREWIFSNSGGHPGLLLTLFGILAENVVDVEKLRNINWIASQNIVLEECQRVWASLPEPEQNALIEYVKESNITSPLVYKLLVAKGILGHPDGTNEKIFSPIFRNYISRIAIQEENGQVTPRSLKVFLCYTSDDKPIVGNLYAQLCSIKGIDPWIADYSVLPGEDWKYAIQKALKETNVVLVCLNCRTEKKEGYIQKEINIALDLAEEKPNGTIFIIPIKVEECKVPEKLARWQSANYFNKEDFKRLLASLKNRAKSLEIEIMA